MNASSPESRFLRLADAAGQLCISRRQAYTLVRSGELPAIRLGRQWRVERDVLEWYIEAKYEETRRRSLWNQSNLASVTELRT